MKRLILMLILVSTAVLLSDTNKPVFTVHDKAYYADPNVVNFVRPGLVFKITAAAIASGGTITARFTVADPKGLPLDLNGVTTPGPVSVRMVAAYLPKDQTRYVAYTTRPQTSPITGVTAIQASYDTGGTYQQVGDGEYIYTFATKAPTGFDPTATHSIGGWAGRDLSEFDLDSIQNYSSNVFTFVPNGSKVTQIHDEIHTEACNKCHDPLSAHDNRRGVELCVLCHTPQSVDPDTGNTVDFPVMIHKIHMGANLPSVKAGTPYQIIGFQQSVNDFSDVVFPAESPENCQFCHERGPAQADVWLTKPSRKACGACHDNVNFDTGENHVNLPELSDNECSTCHIPQGELPFDASIRGAHTIPRFAPGLPGVVFTLVKVDNGAAGQQPTVTFTLKDKSGNPLQAASMNLLNLVIAGPTTDYAFAVSEDARQAQGGQGGTYSYTFQYQIPPAATGTYTIGVEGYRNVTLLPGTEKEQTVRDAGVNQIINFSVDGSPVQPHLTEVAVDNCNSCHYSLAAHGTIRNQTVYCVLCHNPNETDQAQRPGDQIPPQTIDLPVLIHRIHTGTDMDSPYIVYGFGNTPHDFSMVRFPGDRRDCQKCHVNDSEQLPLPDNLLPVMTPPGFFNPMGPTAAACTGCHTGQDAAAHAVVMTSSTLGESCTVCHQTGADFAVDKVHAR